jgi:uncharacterized protein Usg
MVRSVDSKEQALNKFLTFESEILVGRLHSVRVGTCGILCPIDVRQIGTELTLR